MGTAKFLYFWFLVGEQSTNLAFEVKCMHNYFCREKLPKLHCIELPSREFLLEEV